MKRLLLSLLTVVLFYLPVHAEALIPLECRVKNQDPGYCAWASLETMCRHQKIEAGYGLVEKRKQDPDIWRDGKPEPRNVGNYYNIKEKLEALRILYRIGVWDEAIIQTAVDAGKGCLVDVQWCQQPHAIVILDFDTKRNYVRYFDCNTIEVNYSMTVTNFRKCWCGLAVELSPLVDKKRCIDSLLESF